MGEQKPEMRPHPKSYYDAHGAFNPTREFVLELALHCSEDGAYVDLQTTMRLVWPSGVVPGIDRPIMCGDVVVRTIHTAGYSVEVYRGGREVKMAAVVVSDKLSGSDEDALYGLVDELNSLAYQAGWEGEIFVRSANLTD